MTKLDISSNKLCAAGVKLLSEALKGNQAMTELNLANNRMGMKTTWDRDGPDMAGVSAFANTLPECK